MNILIVHDRQEVGDQIKGIIEAASAADRIWNAEDYHKAREFLSTIIFDLVILDLTIPFFKGGATPDFGAASVLLTELFTHGTLNTPGDVIGITKDLGALSLVGTSFGPHLMTAIEEDNHGLWKTYLQDKVNYVRRAVSTRSISANQHHDVDLLIMTAMDKEAAPYYELLELVDVKHVPGAKEFAFQDKDGVLRRGILFAIGRSGQPAAASFTQSLITAFRPKLALMSGYCGGVSGKVEFGDLIFFEAAYAWDYGKWSEEKTGEDGVRSVFHSRPNPIDIIDHPAHRISRQILQSDFARMPELIRAVSANSKGQLEKINLHLSPAGSGSAVVANDDIISRIRNLNESIWAVDMESYGFYHAAKHTQVAKPHYLCLKAVSDFCNGEKGDNLHAACSFISAKAVLLIIKSYWEF